MKILQVKKFPLYDIFTGEGWDNWVRVKRGSTGGLEVVAGACYEETLKQAQRLINEERNK